MDYLRKKDTLEEGRSALDELERQLKVKRSRAPSAPPLRRNREDQDHGFGTGLKEEINPRNSRIKFVDKYRFSNERQNLDKASRTTRLNHRKDAPLGSLDELDDRGLIVGGSIPSTYSSSPLRLRARRQQEMKDRSSRLQDRELRGAPKSLSSIFHIFKYLNRIGLSIEDSFRNRDPKRSGHLRKKSIISVFRQLGIPLGTKDLLLVCRGYLNSQNSDLVDYERLLHDSMVSIVRADGSQSLEGSLSAEATFDENKMHRNVLVDLKFALRDAVDSLGKSLDDIYGVFFKWDSKGVGTITSAQFLRALDRLHINLSDEDQDTLVEILDYDGMGRIHYEGLLDSCFPQLSGDQVSGPQGIAGEELSDNASISGGSLGASLEGGVFPDLRPRSVATGGGPKKNRPHTASSSRPTPLAIGDNGDNESLSVIGNSPSSNRSRRPLTAAPRLFKQESGSRHEKRYHQHQQQQESLDYSLGDPYVIEVPDHADIINDDTQLAYRGAALTPFSDVNSLEFGTFNVDVESFNENTLISDQDDFLFPSPRSPELMPSRQPQYSANEAAAITSGAIESTTNQPQASTMVRRAVPPANEAISSSRISNRPPSYTYDDYRRSGEVQTEPKDHLLFLATQSLAALREMIIARHVTGKSLRDIFHHFDRRGKFYFDARDLMAGMSDLRIETSEKVADLMISLLAIDGHDKVSFGEFNVFVTDSDHLELERKVQQQLADLLERQGRDFQVHLYDVFWDKNDNSASIQSGMVGITAFQNALSRMGLVLQPSDVQRMVSRFCIHGQDECSVTRFVRMAQNNTAWRNSEKVLAMKEEAAEEAQTALRQLKQGIELVPGLTEDVIRMAEYLGIRVLSEPGLLWIASEAFVAPLPADWTTHNDADGRLFFHNSASNVSQWDHPLDNYFRNLRDKNREEIESNGKMHPAPPSAPYFNSRPISYPASERESTFLGPSNEGSNAVWRDIPHHSITSESKTQHVYDSRGASRPTSAPFSSLRSITPQPKYPAHISGGESAKEYTKVGIAENQRPSSAIAESYTRQKFQVDRKNQNHSDRSDGLKYLNVPGSSSDATSIIDRVVNFGRDPPAYLRPKGSRAQSAGHQRALDREAAGRNKQFAMMYAEELIQKLDSVILSGGKNGGGEMRDSRKRADSDAPVPVRKRKDGGIVMIL